MYGIIGVIKEGAGTEIVVWYHTVQVMIKSMPTMDMWLLITALPLHWWLAKKE